MTLLERLKQAITVKILFIGFLILMLLIPVAQVEDLIHERKARRNSAVSDITSKWGSSQTLIGAVLTIPYKRHWKDKKNKWHTTIEQAHFLPEKLAVDGNLATEVRYRGIFEVVLYKSKVQLRGHFARPNFRTLKINEGDIIWKDAALMVGITDMRGIGGNTAIKWNGRKLAVSPGTLGFDLFSSGMTADLVGYSPAKKNSFAIDLQLQGSEALEVIPVGKKTTVKITSPWPHPSFTGNYLPEKRTITDKGFEAEWNLSYFARNYPQQWKSFGNNTAALRNSMYRSSFGVELFMPVDFYQKSMRSVKYAVLFIMLTFLAFFIFEIIGGLRIHPLQYLLVGFAMCMFYLLFLSLSEHIDFVPAYLVASTSTIGLITLYCMKVLKEKQRAYTLGGMLVTLYVYLFVLLQNEDYALLLGSLALFIILGVVMYITRNIDWYELRLSARSTEAAQAM